MIADLKAGNLDWADQVPFKAVNAVKKVEERRRDDDSGRGDDEHHLELEPGQAEEP